MEFSRGGDSVEPGSSKNPAIVTTFRIALIAGESLQQHGPNQQDRDAVNRTQRWTERSSFEWQGQDACGRILSRARCVDPFITVMQIYMDISLSFLEFR